MSRKLFILVSMAIMAVLAVVVAKVFQEPYPVAENGRPLPGIESPAPAPDSSSVTLPVIDVSPDGDEDTPHQVAGMVSDRVSGSGTVTEPPAAPPAVAEGETPPASEAPTQVAQAPQAPAIPTTPPAPESPDTGQPAPAEIGIVPPATTETPPSVAGTTAAPSASSDPATPPTTSSQTTPTTPAPPATQATPQTPVQTGTQAPAVRPGTLVTKSTLPARSGRNVVTTATLTMDGDVITLRLEGSAPIKGTSFLLKEPDRGVLDLTGSWSVEAPRVTSNRMLKALRVGEPGATTRLVFDMKVKPARINVTQVSERVLEVKIR